MISRGHETFTQKFITILSFLASTKLDDALLALQKHIVQCISATRGEMIQSHVNFLRWLKENYANIGCLKN